MAGLIVHEWFEQYGGAEKVVEEMAGVFPDAGIACLWDDYPGRFARRPVTESWLARTSLRRHKSVALPFMLPTWRSIRVPEVPDWILCSSHLFAHHAKLDGTFGEVPKYVYAYTPARYIWNPELDQRGNSPVAKLVSKPLQAVDRARAKEAASIACVSEFVRSRVQDAWQRDCEVIHPPVNFEYYASSRQHELDAAELDVLGYLPGTYVLGASRFIPYKRLDLVIEFGAVNDIPVVLAGGGPEEDHLRTLAASAPVPVLFVSKPSQALLRELYARALAYIFPPVEDFGIMPVEANAAGTPVVAGRIGGSAETVANGVSGVLLDSFSPSEMRAAAGSLTSITAEDCGRQATEFEEATFREAIERLVG
ncbi:glycosyltransferase [Kocuria sp. M1R5S2]|uniref:glycosyltransferase n=1 Tax=Kocuria rhizosphaerae TaxID=3376285 RepID=UPI0037B68DF4